MDHKDTASVINDLIQTCKDGEDGFLTCSENAKAPELKTFFASRARGCSQAAAELQQHVSALGVEPETTGTVAGALHRGWVDLKAAITGQDDVAILNECERGEDVALKSYRDALAKDLPPLTRDLVARQAMGAQRNHDEVKALRNRYRAAEDAGSSPSAIIPPGSTADSRRDTY